MATSILHDVDGTLMIEIPSSVLEELGLSVNSRLDVLADGGRIVAVPQTPSRRKLEKQLANSDRNASHSENELQHASAPAVAKETNS